MSRSVQLSSSPLLASKTPVWRSKLIVAAMALAFVGLAVRAAYVQVFENAFYKRQGEVRFARTLTLPANLLRVSVNERYGEMHTPLTTGDRIVFIPPVAGG